jgi:hypothetical protein
MKTWPSDASEHFESWLGRVRRSVAADPTINADDVAQDLRAHVYAELEERPEPVTVGALEQVLVGLGNPTQWTDAARPMKDKTFRGRLQRLQRRTTATVTAWQRNLAGEWGFPILLAVLTLIAIPTFEGIGFPLMLFAFFVARSQVSYAPQTLVGRRRLLVYFPLAIGCGVLVGLVLSFPLMVSTDLNFRGRYFTMWWLGAWWAFVGILAAREPKRVQSALKPFANGFEASHGRLFALIGGTFLIAATVMLFAD